jgi:hypothetical protein
MMVPIHQTFSRHLSRHGCRRQTRAFGVRNLRFVTYSTKDDLKGASPIMFRRNEGRPSFDDFRGAG